MAGTDRSPWQWPDRDALPTLFGGLVAPTGVDRAIAMPVLRSAVDMVMGWVGVELTWSTLVDVVEDGVGNPRADAQRAGVDWEFASDKPGTARWVYLEAVCTQLAEAFGHPNRRVAQVSARFPTPSGTAGRDVGRMTVGVSVQRWALYGSGEELPWFAPTLGRWMVDSAAALGAESGFALLDRVQASDLESPWERRARAYADADQVWGYGWGTLLGAALLDRIGGAERLRQLPDARVDDLAGGRVWLTLGDDPADVPEEEMQSLHELLRPALVEARQVEQAMPASVPNPAPVSVEQLRRAWERAGAAIRTGGRSSGIFGPVGFSVPLLDLFAPFATEMLSDTLVFAGVGDQQAAVLLTVLSGELLDVQIGAGPTLRRVLKAMVDHPGRITASGLLFGPTRDDEGVMVDAVRVQGDPVLAGLEPDAVDAAYRRLIALGVEGAVPPEEAGPSADGSVWGFWWD